MRKITLTMLLLILGFLLVGCTDKEEVEKKEVDPKELLLSLKNDSPLVPIGDIPIPEDNPMTPEVLDLGQKLFFDPRLSGNNERSCSSCHDPNLGYGDDRPTFETYDGGDGARNSPTIINAGYYKVNFWDGRAGSLEEQALGPIQNPNEMNQKMDELVKELKAINGYEGLFMAAFNEGITEQNIAKALAAFERQIVVTDTPYDRFLQGDTKALNAQELRGLSLFSDKAFCSKCHNGPNLSDNNFYNTGIESDDEGLFAITKKAGDVGKFRTAGLYGITHTAPYMRDGSIATLEDVIEFYNNGGGDHRNKSFYFKNFMPLNLTKQEKADLLAFLKTLGGEPPIFEKPELPGM
ncbi:cytochrome-c peroxidase [Neobacillus sp. LXY-4]|uniref:cytochrome-c peroxidase n=1 Tax=Neobacillus sp. LXY-4 TaxID=3379826 RepID=UPI003EE23AB0